MPSGWNCRRAAYAGGQRPGVGAPLSRGVVGQPEGHAQRAVDNNLLPPTRLPAASRIVLQLLQTSNRAPAFDRRHAKLSSCALSDTIVCATSQGAPLSVCIGFLYAYLLTSQKDCIVPLMPVNMCARTVDVAIPEGYSHR